MGLANVRIRGKVGTAAADNPPEIVGKFFFKITLWTLDGEELIEDLGDFGPFETEKIAKARMGLVVKDLGEMLAAAEGGATDGFIDFKNGGVKRSWNEN